MSAPALSVLRPAPPQDRAQLPQSEAPEHVDPAEPLIRIWALLYFLSALFAVGVTPALRGTWVGIDRWIERLDQFTSLTSQATAVLTTLLLVHFAQVTVRTVRPLPLVLLAALLGAVPALFLIAAQKLALPSAAHLLTGGASSALLLLAFLRERSTLSPPRVLLLLALLVCGAKTLTQYWFSITSPTKWLVLFLAIGFCASLLLTALTWWLYARGSESKRLFTVIAAGLTVLLARTVEASSFRGVADWIVLTGRSLIELRGPAAFPAPGVVTLLLAGTLLAGLWVTLSSRDLLAHLAAALALSAFLPLSPLVVAAFALSGFALFRTPRTLGPIS